MGGKSSSNSTTSNTTTNDQNSLNIAADDAGAPVVAAEGAVTITQTDHGALRILDQQIENAMHLVEGGTGDVLEFAGEVYGGALSVLAEDRQKQYSQQTNLLGAIASASRSETSSQLETFQKYLFAAVGLGLVVVAWKGAKFK